MPETLPVEINRDRIHDIDVPPSFEVTDSFVVRVENHGSATHVHLHLDDALSRVAAVGTDNHYVESDSTRDVVVQVADGPRPAEGTLEVVTGYGAETARVAIDVVEPDPAETSVDVDEAMSKPPTEDSSDPPGNTGTSTRTGTVAGLSPEVLPVVALAGVAIAFAILAAVISDSLAVMLGVAAVIAGVGSALVMLREP